MVIKKALKWLTKIIGIYTETPFEIVEILDLFVKDKLNSILNEANSFDIATGNFKISGWQASPNR
jgi:hypothetical protein